MILRISILLSVFIPSMAFGQIETYSIGKTKFSSDKYDEYAPIYYKNGIVFCSNRNIGFTNYSSTNEKGLLKIFYTDTAGNVSWQNSKLFSKNLTSITNDGPVTFNSTGDTIYYSRNVQIEGNQSSISTARNKLGIFSAVFNGKKWINIHEFKYNNKFYNAGYNVTTPCLSSDGKKLFFASDMPGGYGGSDLYYCQWKNNDWDKPINMGSVINTSGNEVCPFINSNGELLFSSDGHPGLGGKDIYFTQMTDSVWIVPVPLDPPINSIYDDFGIVTDSTLSNGFFSSNRGKSLDIFSFKTNLPQIFVSKSQYENKYCYTFSDSGKIIADTSELLNRWSFGDGNYKYGSVVKYCFSGNGTFNVRLDLVEGSSGSIFFTKLNYVLKLHDAKQPYINAPRYALKGTDIEFDGLKSYFPGFRILDYTWDFGDGNKTSGSNVHHSYNLVGDYTVKLGLTLKSELTGKIIRNGVSRKIMIINNNEEKEKLQVEKTSLTAEFPDIRKSINADIQYLFSAEKASQQNIMYSVELMLSPKKIDPGSYLFKGLSKNFTLSEFFNPDDKMYHYTVDKQLNLMATYQTYSEMLREGFKNVHIKTVLIKDPAEIELLNLMKTFNLLTDSNFDSYERLSSNAFIMLDKVISLMKNFPTVKIEIAVHSDNSGVAANNIASTQRKSLVMVNYLISRGISGGRLATKGYGGTRPVAPNFLESDRKLNRRIELRIFE
jgi:outer membrane protein OmpA-like peptidoglycan-associated protein